MEDVNFPEALYKSYLREINGIKFTAREIDVIAFLLSGRSRKKTALFLEISPKTVENHIRNIVEKLGCSSQEGVVDFIEKSGKLFLIKQYYVGWVIHTEFERILKKLALRKEGPACLIVSWPFQEEKYEFLSHLKTHLKLAGIKVTSDGRKESQPLSSLLSEPAQGIYKLYFLSTLTISSAENFHNKSSSDNFLTSKLFFWPEMDSSHKLIATLPAVDFIGLHNVKNYYFLVFEILKRLFINHPIEKLALDFQRKTAAFEMPTDASKLLVGRKPLKNKGEVAINIKKLLDNYILIFSLLCGTASLFGLLCFYGGIQLSPPAISNQPHGVEEPLQHLVRSPLFIPSDATLLRRPGFLDKIDTLFKRHPGGIPIIALTGIGGSGKTTLAREYARLQNIPVIWEMDAETSETLLNSFEDLAYAFAQSEGEKKLLKGIGEIKKQEERVAKLLQFVKQKLQSVSHWLLIFDNADNMNKIWGYFPDNAGALQSGKIIVTTRNHNLKANGRISEVIQVKELAEKEKFDLFIKIMATDTLKKLTPAQEREAKAFLKHLPPFPLDISAAAYYLKATDTSYHHYLDYIHQPNDDFSEVQENILGDVSEYTKSRYQIISIPLKRLLETNPDFNKPLLFIALLEASHIPRELLEEITDNMVLDKLIVNLKRYALISTEASPGLSKVITYSIHHSTQTILLAYLVKVLELEKNPHLVHDVIEAFLGYTARSVETEDFDRMKVLLPHGETLLNHQTILKVLPTTTRLGYALGCLYFYLGKYPEAKGRLNQNVHRLLTLKKIEDLWDLRTLTYLGAVNISLGDQETAKKYLAHAVKGYKENFPKSYTGQAQALRYLATVYRDLGDYKTAKGLFEESLSIYQGYLPQNYVGVARALGYVGDIWREIGDFEKSKDFLEQSYTIHKEHFPDNKLGILWNLAHLGEIYGILGNYETAKNILEECLQVCKDYLPENHAYFPWISGCLGTAYGDLGLLAEAEVYLTNSASLFQKNFKGNNVYYFWALWHLGVVYGELKEFEKAKRLLRESLGYLEKEYGKDHIEIGRIFQALARVHLLEGDFNQAKAFANQSINILQKQKHAYLYTSFERLAEIHLAKSQEAQKKGEQVLSQSYQVKALESFRAALRAVKGHFREDSPFALKIEKKIRELSPNCPLA